MPQKRTDTKTLSPRQGGGQVKRRPERMLLICYYDPRGISTVRETVAFMQACSRFPVTILNMYEHRHSEGHLSLAPSIDLDSFSGVIIHNTVSYVPAALWSLDQFTTRKLKDFVGVKVIMKQDENHELHKVVDYIGKTGFNLILTVLPDEAVPLVYPERIVGRPRFYRMLTGYITPTLRAIDPNAGDRAIDIGYRGSLQSLSFGRLAYEKRKIGEDLLGLLADSGLVLDISSRWEDRFGGDAWFSFLSSSKATLGAESGASLFDLDGDLDARIAAILAELGPEQLDAEYAEAYLGRLQDLEDNVHYHQISPRHFEAIACGTIQLLYPGTYSGILAKDRHYFSLERDYSNLDEAVALIRDDTRRKSMAATAYEEIILDRTYWIETFVDTFDNLVEEICAEKNVLQHSLSKPAGKARNILLLAAQDPKHDPRHRWVEEMAAAGSIVHQLGIAPAGNAADLRTGPRGGLDWAVAKRQWKRGGAIAWYPYASHNTAGTAALQELAFLEAATALQGPEFRTLFSAPASSQTIGDWWWHLRDILDITMTLVDTAAKMRGVHAIVASDLHALPAALILKALFDVPVLYDAHEYMPEMNLAAPEFQKQFFAEIETRLVQHTDFRQTVSPGLASIMSQEYGVAFDTVPNCEPAASALEPDFTKGGDRCVFLFLGLFAAGRGINLLIDAWPHTNENAILHLQGPDNDYKRQMVELARSSGLLDTRIFFPEPVAEDALIANAHKADVGLIPYEPIGTNHQHCCPNKMSQYMAAGIALLANSTNFVAETIAAAQCGVVVNFAQTQRLATAISDLALNPGRRQAFARAGNSYFRSTFNWNVQSESLKTHLAEMTRSAVPEILAVYSTALPGTIGPDEPLIPPNLEMSATVTQSTPAEIAAVPELPRRATLPHRVWRHLPRPLKQIAMPFAQLIKNAIR